MNLNYQFYEKPNNYLYLINFSRLSKPSHIPSQPVELYIEAINSLLDPNTGVNQLLSAVYPLVYKNIIQEKLKDRIRPEIVLFLKSATYRLVARDIIQKKWLSKVISLLQQDEIPVILLKGAAFAGCLYPDTAPRLGSDIDLLVRSDDFDKTCALLDKIMEAQVLDPNRLATHNTLFERVFSSNKNGSPIVEIHRGLTNPHLFRIEENKLWKASTTHPAFKSEFIRMLSPEDTLLHLAIHAFRDLDFCTHNLLDAHEVWCQWKPEPEKLMECAKEWGARKVLFYLLTNCKELMETPIPVSLLASLNPASVINRINKTILQSTALHGAVHNSLSHRLIQLTSQITFPDHILRGLEFQFSYARTRMYDWIKQH